MPNVSELKLGLNVPATLPVGQFRSYEGTFPVWTQEQIKQVQQLKQRSRNIYGKEWIKNQNPYNSCASHGGTNAVERRYFEKTGKRIQLQPHFLYAHVNGGRDQGAILVDIAKMIRDKGIPTIEDAPDKNKIYLSQYGNAELQRLYPRCVKAVEVYEVRTEIALASAIAQGFDCFIAVDVDNGWGNYKGGKLVPNTSGGPGNHCVSCDDVWWDQELGEFVFDTPGSWGTNMGDEKARWPITWKRHLYNTNKYHVFYAITDVRELPKLTQEDLPPSVKVGDDSENIPEISDKNAA